jgi:hypothetical protein
MRTSASARQHGSMARSAMESVLAAGRSAVLRGDHSIEGAPVETGRWGPSVVLLPSGALASALDSLTGELQEVLGEGHWPSGGRGRAHITVRALERYTPSVPPDRSARYLLAMARALQDVGPVTLGFDGVGLSPGSVVAWATTSDGRADRLRERLEEELGDDAWLERAAFENGRDPIWYCSLMHFARPITEPGELVRWIDHRSATALGAETFDTLSLCNWTFDGSAMVPGVIEAAEVPADP